MASAAELGCTDAYVSIGFAYNYGRGIDIDKEKAKHYYELGAIKGSAPARHSLGVNEAGAGNVMSRAIKHFLIAIRSGYSESLDVIQKLYSNGLVAKEDYTKALQLYQVYLGEIKSVQRDKAAADNEGNRYY